MTSTDLDLKRTLTDILEDELYNINYHNQNSKRNVLELSLPTGFEETALNGEVWNDQHPQQHSNHLGHHHQQLGWNQFHEGNTNNDNNIFNKYADPSLTMTSSHHKDHDGNVAVTPVQGTVNLSSVMKVSNPFQNIRYQLPYDVKITNDYHDDIDSVYGLQAEEDLIGVDGFSNPKMHWPLQDSNMALSTEDARMIFDHEFAADDDLSDDEDDSNYDDGNRKVFGACDFVDGARLFGIQDNSNQPIMEDEDDELVDEDELYEPSYRSGKQESVVTTPQSAPVESTPPSTSSAPVITSSRTRNNNGRARRRLPIAGQLSNNNNSSNNDNNNNNNDTNDNDTNNNNINSKVSCVAGHYSSSNSNSGGNNGEIYTCMILNDITKQPCAAQFSRSYDLTRHRNTIHAKKKAIFRCSECIRMLGEDGFLKTFSRLDALTRHIKSKHENLSSEQRQEVTKYAKENIGYVNS